MPDKECVCVIGHFIFGDGSVRFVTKDTVKYLDTLYEMHGRQRYTQYNYCSKCGKDLREQ